MAQWAKNQIAKQLAKFAKNLDPNSLSLKFLKGEGELTNLELEEGVISDLLEFPPWLQLSKVTCNRISAKVPWTSLKSDPLRLILDTVDVQIVASEELRAKSSSPVINKAAMTKPTKYGFSEKVVDGMYVSINTLTATFTSIGFKATVNISRIIVQSTTPEWRQANNLRQTRIKDDEKDEVINFKEIKWGTMRVHADAAYMSESKEIPSTPLRLITNNSMIRLVIKKRMSDCSMVASKLAVILDDILWVLTRSQIIKLSSFVHYIIKLRNKHLPITHQTAAKQEDMPTKSSSVKSQDQLFNAYDIPETSLHLRTHRIDLHLCDDSSLNGNFNKKVEFTSIYDEPGAALQISLINIGLDHYPYHVVGTKRITAKQDDEMAFQRSRWAHQLLNNFQDTEGKRWKKPRNTSATIESRSKRPPRMYESYFLVRCEDYNIMQVTTPSTHNPQSFMKSEKESLFLPKEMPAIQLDHTTYYYTGTTDLPVPSPNVFVQVNPFQLTFDPLTCVWLNRFTQSVAAGLDWTKEFVVKEAGFAEHVNVRLECLMPKILLPFDQKKRPQQEHVDERPTGLQLMISQTVVTNCRVGAKCAQADVLNDLQSFVSSRHYADMSCYPNEKSDFSPFSNSTWLNDYSINCYQLQNLTRRDKDLYSRLKRDNNLPHHIWGIWCDQLWMEFVGVDKAKGRPVTFIDAFPVRLWVCQSVSYATSDERPISPISSGSSIEAAESASESDEFQQSPSLGSRHSQRSSISSENQSLLQVASSANSQQLRSAHSDSDLIDITPRNQGPRHSVSNTAISGENYAWGGPPPPYGGAGNKNVSATSIENLPPSYDAIASEDPGPISKPPIDVCDGLELEPLEVNLPTLALLMNVEKTIQIQLDHFQMLSLLRLGDDVGSMINRIELDNKKQTENLTLEEASFSKDSVVLNISVPHVLVDLILAPCIGIDPIQRLSLKERVQYEKEKVEKSTIATELPVSGDAYILPMRSRGRSMVGSSPRSQSLTGTPNPGISPNLSENRKLSAGTDSEMTPETTNLQRHLSNSSFNDSLYTEQTFKEVRDAQVQAGDPLVDVNLKPSGENQLISVLRIHADSLKVGIQSCGENAIVKVTSNYVNLNELGNMKYGHVLDPRGCIIEDKEPDKQNVNMSTLTGDAMFKLRLISGPEAENLAKDGKDFGFADIRISSLAAALLMSTVDNLTEFGEDEFVQSTMPFKVSIASSDISLYDDKPRRSKAAIKLPPSHIYISELHVERDSTGVVILNQTAQGQTNQQSDLPNNELDTTIGAVGASYSSSVGTSVTDTITQQVDALIGENGRLVEDLKIVNAKVNGLHSERESLLKVIDKLQQELMLSNNENDDLQKRMRSLTLSKRPNHL